MSQLNCQHTERDREALLPNVPNVTWHVPLCAPCHNRVGDIETSKKWKKFGVQSPLPAISWSGDHVQVAMLIVSVRTRRPRGLRLGVAPLTAGRLCVKPSVGRFGGSSCHLHLHTMGSRLGPEHSQKLPPMACFEGCLYTCIPKLQSKKRGQPRSQEPPSASDSSRRRSMSAPSHSAVPT